MCSPHDSSSWIKEWKLQYPQYKNKDLVADQGWDDQYDYTWYKKGSFIDSMKDQAQHIQELYFAGGEPLLIPEHYKILEFMVDEGYAKNCNLRYNSNGLELPDKLFKLWDHFKEVRFNFSIDAYGERNDYIRYPSKWSDVETNLKRLDQNTKDNTVINIACAIQLLNVGYIDELAEWKMDQGFSKINPSMFGGGIIGTHLVYLPSYLNVQVLPQEAKLWAKQKIENFIDRQKFNLEFNQHPYGAQRWRGLIKYMMQDDWGNKLPALQEYLKITDERRETDFRKTFPELGRYM
jgi:MoaA/NifB/PqqE/SkfB family radical SAM enzyme